MGCNTKQKLQKSLFKGYKRASLIHSERIMILNAVYKCLLLRIPRIRRTLSIRNFNYSFSSCPVSCNVKEFRLIHRFSFIQSNHTSFDLRSSENSKKFKNWPCNFSSSTSIYSFFANVGEKIELKSCLSGSKRWARPTTRWYSGRATAL